MELTQATGENLESSPGNRRCRTAQSRENLKRVVIPIPVGQKVSRGDVEARRAAPKPRSNSGEGEGTSPGRTRAVKQPGGESRRRHENPQGLNGPRGFKSLRPHHIFSWTEKAPAGRDEYCRLCLQNVFLRSYTIGAIPNTCRILDSKVFSGGPPSMVGWMFRDVLQYDISYD